MIINSAFWRDLGARFRALPDPKEGLTATLSSGHWSIGGGLGDSLHKSRLGKLFHSLATQAAIAAGTPAGANDGDGWLNLLREKSPNFYPYDGESGWIENLALASADYCNHLEALAFKSEAAPRIGGAHRGTLLTAQEDSNEFRNAGSANERARFVMPILEKNGWSILDWANESDVDFHTANDYLKGTTKRPYRSTRKKLADSLGVMVEALPK